MLETYKITHSSDGAGPYKVGDTLIIERPDAPIKRPRISFGQIRHAAVCGVCRRLWLRDFGRWLRDLYARLTGDTMDDRDTPITLEQARSHIGTLVERIVIVSKGEAVDRVGASTRCIFIDETTYNNLSPRKRTFRQLMPRAFR